MRKRLMAAVGASVCAVGLAVGVPGTALAADPVSYEATLNPITVNKVTGNGAAWITVNGTTAEVKMQVNGLLDGSPHAQHIHVDALGQCPTDANAQQHNGGLSLTVADGAPLYGGIGTSLTTEGDTTPMAGLHVGSFPSAGRTPTPGRSSSTRTWSRTCRRAPRSCRARHRLQRQRRLRRRAGRQRARPDAAGRGHRSGALRRVRADADGRRARRSRGHRWWLDRYRLGG